MVDAREPVDDEMSFLLSITGNMVPICGAALREINLAESDKAIANLIIKYATEIDKGNLTSLAKFGPLLLQAMESLQMSPKSRAVAAKGVTNNAKPASKLDELRSKRLERANRAKDIHSATS